MIIRLLAAIAIVVFLQGCWFVYIPGSTLSAIGDTLTGAEGNLCISSRANIGDKIRMPDGNVGVVRRISGTSTRCRSEATPIRATVNAEP